ncbi:MAG: FAD-dependent oxidoreductase [Kiritimatiellae bacterium]|nr:FAD-dependent oxidoreductase [Kiritimatiellia bacterium]
MRQSWMWKGMVSAVAAMILTAIGAVSFADTVAESGREIPVLKDVDVLVVGGTYGAVGAALAAKEAGSSVFLVAPRTHLGEDVVEPRNLWVDFDYDEGLTESLIYLNFPATRSVTYAYTPSVAPNSGHPDPNNTCLFDGYFTVSSTHSVQYNSDVTLNVTLVEGADAVDGVVLYSFYRAGDGGFGTASISLQSSADGVTYTDVAGSLSTLDITDRYGVETDQLFSLTFTPSQPVSSRYLRVICQKESGRQLLAEMMVSTETSQVRSARPIRIEKSLDNALLEAEIPFLTGSQVTGVLRDGSNNPSGVVIVNRSGRQAIRAKTIVDATEWASVVRQSGQSLFRSVAPGTETVFTRTVTCMTNGLPSLASSYTVTQCLPSQQTVSVTPADLRPDGAPASFGIASYRISRSFPFDATDYAALAEIEQQFHDDTWAVSTVDASEHLSFTPPEQLSSSSELTVWTSVGALSLDSFSTAALPYVYVVGPCADVSRSIAFRLQLPGNAYILGRRIGTAAATAAQSRGTLSGVTYGTAAASGVAEVRERLTVPMNVGDETDATVTSLGANLPVLATADIAVVGLGTAGAPAAIAAARKGKNVLALDYLYTLGGTTTDSRIGRYYRGNAVGFTAELDTGTEASGYVYYAAKSEWLRTTCRTAGVTIWNGVFVEGVVVSGNDGNGHARVTGVVVALPDGTRGVVTCSVVIDSTGNADITAAAGGETTFITSRELALQGASHCMQTLANSYQNYDIGFQNDTDAGDISTFALRARLGIGDSSVFSTGSPYTGSRERRRIVGDVVVSILDVLTGKTWSDTIMHGASNYDMHGFSSSDVLMFYNHTSAMNFAADVPYRALLPNSLEGVIATGLGISAERDAMPIIRMQADVQNQGYAAGLAAAAAVDAGSVRSVNVAAIQSELVTLGALNARVLTDADSSVTQQQVSDAIASLTTNFIGLEYLLAAPETALPLLRQAYATANDTARLPLACALALLGDATGGERLCAALAGDWDTGYNFTGMGNYGRQTSLKDAVWYALSKIDYPPAVPILDRYIQGLDVNNNILELSHFRMAAFAAESYQATNLLPSVLALLGEANICGWNETNATAVSFNTATSDIERLRALRELTLGRMIYHLGDPDGAGSQILNAYATDVRGAYAEHARLVLAEGIPELPITQDGSWIATSATAQWNSNSSWADSTPPSGTDATVTFPATPTVNQEISLGGGLAVAGNLIFNGASTRTFTDGVFSLCLPESMLFVDAGGTAVFETPFRAGALKKQGEGTLVLSDSATLSDGLEIEAGEVSFDNGATVYQPYQAVAAAGDVGNTAVGYGYDFTIVNGPLWVTHLGCYDATPEDGFSSNMETYLASNNTVFAAVRFTADHSGFLRNGYRFLRLAKPIRLQNGTYTIRTFGYKGEQSCIVAPNGENAGTLDNCGGKITFGDSLYRGTAADGFTTVAASYTSYGASAASLLLTDVDPEQSLGTVRNHAALTLATPVTSAESLSGTGTISVARSDAPVSLTLDVPAGQTMEYDGDFRENGENGRLGLVKDGAGTLTLGGTNELSDGVFVQQGKLVAKTMEAIGETSPLIFNTPFAESGVHKQGVFSVEEPDAVIRNPIRVQKNPAYNMVDTGIEAVDGQTVTLRDTTISGYTKPLGNPAVDPAFTFITKTADTPTEIRVEDVAIDYVDFIARVDGNAKKTAKSRVVYDGIRPFTSLRKFVCVNTEPKTEGGEVVLTGTNTVVADYVDISGSSLTFTLSNRITFVTGNMRFPAGIKNLPESNGTVKFLDGSTFVAPVFPATVYNTTNTTLIFDGGTIRLKEGDQGNFISLPAANPPVQILERGMKVNTRSYDNNSLRGARFRFPMTSPVPGVPGPFIMEDGDRVIFSGPMSYNGPTIVKAGTLQFDFTVGNVTSAPFMLKPGTDLVLDGGNFLLKPNTATQGQNFHAISNLSENATTFEVGGSAVVDCSVLYAGTLNKTGTGTLALNLMRNESRLDGTVHVRQGTFRVTATNTAAVPEDIVDGSFEPVNSLEDPAIANRDKRGNRDKTWFPTNLPNWEFDADNNVGVAVNGSYFGSQATNGTHYAFLRNSTGRIWRILTLEEPMRCALTFDFASRNYTPGFVAKIGVWLGNEQVYTSETLNKVYDWQTISLDLGVLQAGTHRIGFGGITGNADAVLDNVKIGLQPMMNQAFIAARTSPDLDIVLDSGTHLVLDFDGDVPVRSFTIDGREIHGTFNAANYPQYISGTGAYHNYAAGTVISVR